MTRQQEIREGITRFVEHYAEAMQTEGEQYPEFIAVDNILCFLHSQGLVIRVERELPGWLKFKWANNPCITSQDDVDEAFTFDIVEDAGLVFTESLIEGGV